MPVEPPPTPWVFTDPRDADPDDDLVGVGADLAPGTLLAAYRRGIFPMPEHGVRPPMHWFSPVERGIVPLDGLVVSRSLRRSVRDFEIRVDTAFDEVVAAAPTRGARRAGSPATSRRRTRELHRLGWAHSVEAWRDGELAGGLYGVGDRRAVRRRVDVPPGPGRLEGGAGRAGRAAARRARGDRLLDVQWVTPHLATLGAVEVPRTAYLRRLERALQVPPPRAWEGAVP